MCRRLWTLSTKWNFRIIKESVSWRRGIIRINSSFVPRCNQLGLTSQTFFPEYNHCPLALIKCVLKKLNWATGQTLTPIGLERVFQRSTQAMDSPLAANVKVASESTLKNHAALELQVRQKKTSKD